MYVCAHGQRLKDLYCGTTELLSGIQRNRLNKETSLWTPLWPWLSKAYWWWRRGDVGKKGTAWW